MDTASLIFTCVFCALLVLGLVTRTWLASRQIRHVARHRDTVPSAFAQVITPAAHRKAADYTITKIRFGQLEQALAFALLLAWTLLGALEWLNQTLLAALGAGMLQQLALLASFVLIGSLFTLPLSWWSTFRIEERFGFNKTSAKLWLGDQLKGAALALMLALPLALMLLWLMESAGTAWWIWAWGVWMAFNLLLLLIYPTLIAPLFNKFEPLPDVSLRRRVNALMQRCGFAAKGLFVMDGSKRSAHANAYFTGFGAAKRVVFFDTLLQKLSPPETCAVLAHELGHYKQRHIMQRILLMLAFSLIGFALLGWLSAQVWFYTGLGVMPQLETANNALALLLFLLFVPLLTFFLSPLLARISRSHEFEADAYAAVQTSAADLASALLKLFKDNASTLTPDPLYARFYYSHPPAAERIARLLASSPSSPT